MLVLDCRYQLTLSSAVLNFIYFLYTCFRSLWTSLTAECTFPSRAGWEYLRPIGERLVCKITLSLCTRCFHLLIDYSLVVFHYTNYALSLFTPLSCPSFLLTLHSIASSLPFQHHHLHIPNIYHHYDTQCLILNTLSYRNSPFTLIYNIINPLKKIILNYL